MPRRLTLDTSCGLNLLLGEPEPDPALMRLLSLGLSSRIHVSIAPTALEEVLRAPDPHLRRRRTGQFGMYPVIQLGPSQAPEREALRDRLMEALFPNSEAGSATWDNNRRDCEHIAAHVLGHGDVFVTLDEVLLRKAPRAQAEFGVRVQSPAGALAFVLPEVGPVRALPPDLAVRDYRPDDDGALRRLLAPLAEDYPNFDNWLTSQMGTAHISLGVVDGQVAAAAIWKPRGSDRVIKLGAFRVDEGARQNSLGPHLLWYLIRTWVGIGTELVYVTLSSRHAELVSFFSAAGFLVQGVTRSGTSKAPPRS